MILMTANATKCMLTMPFLASIFLAYEARILLVRAYEKACGRSEGVFAHATMTRLYFWGISFVLRHTATVNTFRRH
jgi:hypothetical protein